MADEAVILIFGVFLVADPTRNLRSPVRRNMRIFLSTGGCPFGDLRCIMAFGTGYLSGLFWIFLPGVAVRTCEIHVGIPKEGAERHRTARHIASVQAYFMVVQTSLK